jgi:hypothetical protein
MTAFRTVAVRSMHNQGVVMKSVLRAAMLALAIGSSLALVAPASAQTGKISIMEGQKGDGGYWKTTFGVNPPKQLTPEHAAIRDRMMQRRVLEEYAEFLSPVRWPHALRLFASDCSGGTGDSSYYQPKYYFINLCYPYIAFAEKAADFLFQIQNKQKLWTPVSREQLISGMFVATLLHETGHAAFDIMEVPVFGREEDAADQMAGFVALQFSKQTARTVIKGRGYFWAFESLWMKADPPITAPNTSAPNYPKDPESRCWLDPFCAYADEHGTAGQRMYNVLCIAYGGDPENFKDFIDAGWLPPERAKGCGKEYQRIRYAFGNTILPFIDQEQMKKVQAKEWFQGAELKER